MKNEEKLGALFWFLVIVVMWWMIACSCNSKKNVPLINEHESSVTVRERIVTVRDTITVKEDSATGAAWFECDSLNRVRLKALNISESERLRLKALYDAQKQALLINALRPADTIFKTVFVPLSDTNSINQKILYIEKPVEVEKEVYPKWMILLSIIGTGFSMWFILKFFIKNR